MPKGKKGNAFEDPAVRNKAIAARLSNPHGRRQAKYKDVPGLWDEDVDSLGRQIRPKEKAAISAHFGARFEELDDLGLDALEAVLTNIKANAKAGTPLTMPEAQVLGKFLDKKAPDLRTDLSRVPTGRVTRFVIGAPLKRLVSNGAMLAGEILEQTAEDDRNGEVP
jgi:hypothetical protein